MRNLDIDRLELDEIWTFCGKKQKRLTGLEKRNPLLGDQYVFYAIDPVSKLVPVWDIGKRDIFTTQDFVIRLKRALNGNRPQISSDAFSPYYHVIDEVFNHKVDYAIIHKEYSSVWIGRGRYAPPHVSGIKKRVSIGNPDERYICTSYIERANLTLRTMQRRFTRLSLGFSRKMENLIAATSLHFAYYNFCWTVRTTGKTPAMAANVTDKVWKIKDLVGDC